MLTVSKIAKNILNSFGWFVDEEVLCVPRKSLEGQIKLSERKMVRPSWKAVSKNVRHEPGESLHDALGNWAGGHVRKEDLDEVASKWESVLAGLRRELHEELSLEDLPHLEPIGIVHSTENERAARHIGIVFQIVFSGSANIAAFDNKTIRERPNRRVRTRWMEKKELSSTLKTQRDWSRAISNFLVEA